MTIPEDSSEQRTNQTSGFKRVILWLGLACCLQFLVFGLVGVLRGYSVQSWAPLWILLIGIVLLMPFSGKSRMTSFLSSGLLILYALVGISQGKHLKRGEELYAAKKYQEAMVEFRKEIDTWYLRLKFNYREDASMFGIANCHSQLEQFGETRETYLQMMQMFRGYYKGRAEEAQIALDANLVKVSEYEKLLAAAADDDERTSLRFDLALVYRELTCSKKAIEQYEAIEELKVPEPFKKQARGFAEELR